MATNKIRSDQRAAPPPVPLLAPERVDTDIIRRRIALDQHGSPLATEGISQAWERILFARTHEDSRAVACPALIAGELW